MKNSHAQIILDDLAANLHKYHKHLKENDNFYRDLQAWLKQLAPEKQAYLFDQFVPWHQWYELPFITASLPLLEFGHVLNKVPKIDVRAPHTGLNNLIQSATFDQPKDEWEALDMLRSILGPLYVNLYSLKSMSYYGLPIQELVEIGSPESLLAAITIDPTVSGCTPFIKLLSVATALNDQKFINAYKKALSGPHKNRGMRKDVRLMDVILQDSYSAIGENFTDSAATKLLIDELGIYNTDEDPVAALKQSRVNWAKERNKIKR
jgi:hypothetical protein